MEHAKQVHEIYRNLSQGGMDPTGISLFHLPRALSMVDTMITPIPE